MKDQNHHRNSGNVRNVTVQQHAPARVRACQVKINSIITADLNQGSDRLMTLMTLMGE